MEDLHPFPSRINMGEERPPRNTTPTTQSRELSELLDYLDEVNAPTKFNGRKLSPQERVSWFVQAASVAHQERPEKLHRIQQLSHSMAEELLKQKNRKLEGQLKKAVAGGPMGAKVGYRAHASDPLSNTTY